MLQSAVQARLAAILPAESVLTAPEATKPYECDGLTLFREVPAAVVLPICWPGVEATPTPTVMSVLISTPCMALARMT